VSPELSDNDNAVALAYGVTAKGAESFWLKFARAEVEAIIDHLHLEPEAKIIDVGCGVGRHGLEFAVRGCHVRALDFAEGCVDRAREEWDRRKDEIAAAGGSFYVTQDDARSPEPQETADLVLCLYDVLGSSPLVRDAEGLADSLFQFCRPGGVLVLGCMSGTQVIRGLSQMRIVTGRPNLNDLDPVSITQRCREAFDFTKMAYDPHTGVLYHRESIETNGTVVLDKIVEERRYLPAEVVDLLRAAGFVDVSMCTVRAGKWDFSAPFDPDAPEVVYTANRPTEIVASIPRNPFLAGQRPRGHTIELIPKDEIQPAHAGIVSRIFCTSFGKNPHTKKMHVLGPKRMHERLKRCSYLCLAGVGGRSVGYMFGTEYRDLFTTIAWLDSICVLKEHRRKGLATAMLDAFARAVPQFNWLGATSPNPVTPLVLEKLKLGQIYLPGRPVPSSLRHTIYTMLDNIQGRCEDLKGCEIDKEQMLVRTRFAIDLDREERDWNKGESAPAWWTQLANLPSEHESLLIIHRDARDLIGDA
jgi:SAM-dependent methyltransferase/GNAT superfamily N-acetyltransferase